jgi:hypothetical protein
MVRRLSKIAVVAALLVLVASGTWACLYASADPGSAATARVVAICAAIVTVLGIVARGQSGAAVAKARQAIGAIGLFLTPVAAALTLLALVDPPTIPWFVLLTVLALLAWMQGVAAQTGLSLGVTSRWFVTMLVFTVAALIVGGVIAVASIGVWEAFGLHPDASARVAFGLGLASIGAALFVWARSRRDRQALGGAIGRAAFGRARPGDIALLAAGPGPILRRSTTEITPAEHDTRDADRDARLAVIDATLAGPSPADREAPAGDR